MVEFGYFCVGSSIFITLFSSAFCCFNAQEIAFLCCLIEGLYFESIMGNVSCNYALRVALLLGDELVIFLLAYLQIYISGLLD